MWDPQEPTAWERSWGRGSNLASAKRPGREVWVLVLVIRGFHIQHHSPLSSVPHAATMQTPLWGPPHCHSLPGHSPTSCLGAFTLPVPISSTWGSSSRWLCGPFPAHMSPCHAGPPTPLSKWHSPHIALQPCLARLFHIALFAPDKCIFFILSLPLGYNPHKQWPLLSPSLL